MTFVVESDKSSLFGWLACALSIEIITDFEAIFSKSSYVPPNAFIILFIVSFKNVEFAPCFVKLPTSSLSNEANKLIFSEIFPSRNPNNAVYELDRSSKRIEANKLLSYPMKLAFCRLYKNKSCPIISPLSIFNSRNKNLLKSKSSPIFVPSNGIRSREGL